MEKAVLDKSLPEHYDGFEDFSWHPALRRLTFNVFIQT